MTRLSNLSRSIEGSVAFITGAASGIGKATAQLFVDEGARVAIVDSNHSALEMAAKGIRDAGGEVLAIPADCSDREAITQAVERSARHFGRLDIVINNAGVVRLEAFGGENFDHNWEISLAVMVTAQQWIIRSALPWLYKAEYPRIINIASTEALGATSHNSAYITAKHASLGLTRALAVELGKAGITVNAVCPGPVRTGITEVIPDQDKQSFADKRTALRRYGDPEEISHIILSLVMPAASFITGAAIPVDGGLMIRNA